MAMGATRHTAGTSLSLAVLFSGLLILFCLGSDDHSLIANENGGYLPNPGPCHHADWRYLPAEIVTFLNESCGAPSLPQD
jgi:hypothetical protein